jgi:hypothetical protein
VAEVELVVLQRERRQVGPKCTSWPMHFCEHTAIKCGSKLTQLLGQLGVFLTCATTAPAGPITTWQIRKGEPPSRGRCSHFQRPRYIL